MICGCCRWRTEIKAGKTETRCLPDYMKSKSLHYHDSIYTKVKSIANHFTLKPDQHFLPITKVSVPKQLLTNKQTNKRASKNNPTRLLVLVLGGSNKLKGLK